MNFLEQLAAEWFAYLGYYVRTNVKTNKRKKGGWANEIDVLAVKPAEGELIHAETSWDSSKWPARKARFLNKKFVYSRKQYEELVGIRLQAVKKLAIVCGSKSSKADLNWGNDIEVKLIPVFVAEIASTLRTKNPLQEIVPEGYPRLRAMQFAIHFGVEEAD
ncbi:MAG: hypothetical protein HY300_16145 [Verrucomicrobia bacterium]|nr:hypothetical protein [Verrucomicrobiota bacterium]